MLSFTLTNEIQLIVTLSMNEVTYKSVKDFDFQSILQNLKGISIKIIWFLNANCLI